MADVRARWRSLVLAGLIAGVAAGLAAACLSGGVRTGTALERLRAKAHTSDALVFSSQVGAFHPDWTLLEDRPEVANLARWALVFGDIGGQEGQDELLFAPADDRWLRTVDRPVIVDGRDLDHDADDELLVAEGLAAQEGIAVGDTVPFTPFTTADAEVPPPSGPHLELRVVGIMRTPLEPLWVADGFAVASRGLLTRHPEVAFYENAAVQLHDGPAAARDLQAHVDGDVAPGTPILDLEVVARRVTATTDVERTVLFLLAAVIALAGVVLAGQVVSRSAAGIGDDARTLSAFGLPRRGIALAAALAHGPAAAVAAVTCLLGVLVVSRWLPFGLAARLDPDLGAQLDLVVTGPACAVVVLAVLGGSFLAAWRVAGTDHGRSHRTRPGLLDWVRTHAPVLVGLGTTMAFRAGRGRRGIPTRPALLGAVVGVMGVAGAATVDAGLHDALAHPERAGMTWDAMVLPAPAETGSGAPGLPVDAVLARPEVDAVARVDRRALSADGVGVPAWALRAVDGSPESPIDLAVLDGRPPEVQGEAAIGPETAKALGVGIGETIELEDGREVTVVGTALFPAEVHAGFDEGIWLRPGDFDDLAPFDEPADRALAVRLTRGVGVDEGVGALAAAVAPTGGFATPAEAPPELTNLQDVVPLPRWLAGFLAVLALAALLHVLTSSARARQHDFAVLRALGVTRRGTRLVVHVQGLATVLAGLALGLPVGVALGRVGWQLITERVPLAHVAPVAAVALVLLVPAAGLLSQVVALGPGRRLRRLAPAEVLRSE